jgi:hypothetical protein
MLPCAHAATGTVVAPHTAATVSLNCLLGYRRKRVTGTIDLPKTNPLSGILPSHRHHSVFLSRYAVTVTTDVTAKMHAPPSDRRLAGKLTEFLLLPSRAGRTPEHGAEFAVVMTMELETFDRKLDRFFLRSHWHDLPLSSRFPCPLSRIGLALPCRRPFVAGCTLRQKVKQPRRTHCYERKMKESTLM